MELDDDPQMVTVAPDQAYALLDVTDVKAAAPPPLERVHDRIVQQFRSEEHTSELQSLMRISYAVFCLKTTNNIFNAICSPIVLFIHKRLLYARTHPLLT